MLKRKLRIAGINKKPKAYMDQVVKGAVMVGLVMLVFTLVLSLKLGFSIFIAPVAGLVFLGLTYMTILKSVDAKISKRAKEIDKDVLFAGRFLLIKLNSGKPLVNSLVEASQSYGIASHYFKEIVRNIELGTPLEEALEFATDYCPSKKMKMILFQINSALKAGIDVTKNLESVLEEISNEQLNEIQRYGKKLNGLTLFYMLLAVVVPSLGLTMFIVVASLVSLSVNATIFFVFTFFLLLLQFVFLSMFKAIRPSVNI